MQPATAHMTGQYPEQAVIHTQDSVCARHVPLFQAMSYSDCC